MRSLRHVTAAASRRQAAVSYQKIGNEHANGLRRHCWRPNPPLLRWYSWIPVLSLLIIRPVGTWSYCRPVFFQSHNARPLAPIPLLEPKRSFGGLLSSSSSTTTKHPNTMPRRSSRTVATSAAKASPDEEEVTEQIPSPSPPRKRKGTVIKATTTSPAKKKKKTAAKKESPPKKSRAKKGDSSSEASKQPDELPEVNDDDDDDGATDSSPQKKKAKTSSPKTKKKSSPKKKAAADHQRITERGALPRLWDANAAAENDGSYTFRIASWNVAGLRAVMKKHPAGLADLCQKHDLDMLCLQETKLQEIHLDDPKLKLRGCLSEAGYDEYWSCSRAKKGYSGTAIFVKQRGTKKGKKKQSDIGSFFGAPAKKSKVKGQSNVEEKGSDVLPELVTPTDVSYNIIGKPIDEEGRTITLEFPFATITNVYVPNSGQKLERLDYRTKEWDKDFLAFHQKKESDRGLPVIWLGDLNIAHKAYDIWNDGAKHLAKQAGVTEQERVSFQEQLDAGYIDAFRKLHPEAKGHYSYWSQRAGNREPNQGLRLDYFVCSPGLFSEESKVVVRDSYMVPDQLGSDHAPVVLEIELKKD